MNVVSLHPLYHECAVCSEICCNPMDSNLPAYQWVISTSTPSTLYISQTGFTGCMHGAVLATGTSFAVEGKTFK